MSIALARPVRISGWLSCFGVAVALACSRSAPPPAPPAVPVRIATVERRTVPIELDAIGTVTPVADVAVKAQVEGPIAEIHVAEGQDVAPGDLLFTIDPAPFRAALDQAHANLARNEAQAALSRTTRARQEQLFAEGVASKQVLDDARAQAAVDQTNVAGGEAAVRRAELDLEHTAIHAAIAGRLGALLVHQGDMVKSEDTTLITINQIAPIDVQFTVPEPQLPAVQAAFASGAVPVVARAGGSTQPPEQGALRFVDNRVDRATGTIALKGRFANDDRRLWPGQYVDVTMRIGERADAIVVPQQAVQAGQNGDHVFVVDDQEHAQVRDVKVDFTRAGVAVVASGVAPGERVVVDGQLRLAPGTPVKIETTPARVSDAGAHP